MKYTGIFVSTIGDSDCYDIESCTFVEVTIEAESYSDAVDELERIRVGKLHGLYKWRNWKLWDVETNS